MEAFLLMYFAPSTVSLITTIWSTAVPILLAVSGYFGIKYQKILKHFIFTIDAIENFDNKYVKQYIKKQAIDLVDVKEQEYDFLVQTILTAKKN